MEDVSSRGVMPRLDPGIHRPFEKMDCRVKPGNDGRGSQGVYARRRLWWT